MNTKNTIKLDTFLNLSQLLAHGFSLEEGLTLLETFESNRSISKINVYLKEGYSFLESLNFFKIDQLFLDTLRCLFPLRGLSKSLNEAASFVYEKEKWLKLLKKQWLYPLFLISIMTLFSVFIKLFLLPEMDRLFVTFGQNTSLNSSSHLTLISMIPTSLLLLVACIFVVSFIVWYAISLKNNMLLERLLKVPLVNSIIQTYYSLKFAFYFSKISIFFESFYETMQYLNQFFKESDLCIVIVNIQKRLKEGYTLIDIIRIHPYFTKTFKQYFLFIIQSSQSFELLNNYCEFTFQILEKKFKMISKIILFIVYFFTGVYVLSLYSLMILPVLEITNAL